MDNTQSRTVIHELLKNKPIILFDIGYTLDYPASGDWEFTMMFYELSKDRLSQCCTSRIHDARIAGQEYLKKNHFIMDEADAVSQFYNYYRIVSEILEIKLTPDELQLLAHDRIFNLDNYVAYPDTVYALQRISQTHRIGVVSDTWPGIDHQLQALGIRQFISFETYSYSLGVMKPDQRMFLDALLKCGGNARDTVYIDDIPQNLASAAELGITPILIDHYSTLNGKTPFLKINSLSELL